MDRPTISFQQTTRYYFSEWRPKDREEGGTMEEHRTVCLSLLFRVLKKRFVRCLEVLVRLTFLTKQDGKDGRGLWLGWKRWMKRAVTRLWK